VDGLLMDHVEMQVEALCVLDTCALQVASSLSSTHAIVTCHRRMPSSHAIVTLPSSHAIVAPSLSSTHRCLIVVLYTCSSVCPGHMRSTGCHIVHADLATESVYTCMQHVYTRAHTHKKTHTHTHTQHTHITHTIQNTLCSRTLADNVQPLCVGRVSNGSGHIHRRSGVLELRRCWPWWVHYLGVMKSSVGQNHIHKPKIWCPGAAALLALVCTLFEGLARTIHL